MYPLIIIGNFYFPTYFLLISLGYCVGIYYLFRRADKLGLNTHTGLDLSLILMIAGFLGSRLFHVFYERPDIYLEDPIQILKFWQGGFVFYGGVILAVPLAVWLVRRRGENVNLWLSAFAPVVPVVYAIGRIATFFSGSGYGTPTRLPWGVVFPPGTEAPAGVMVHPTQLYAAMAELLVLGLVLVVEKNTRTRIAMPFWVMVIGHALGRLTMEQFRNDFRGDLVFGLSISTWISASLIVMAIVFLLRPRSLIFRATKNDIP